MVGSVSSHSEATRSHDDRMSSASDSKSSERVKVAQHPSSLSSVYRFDPSSSAAVKARQTLPPPNKTPSLSSRSSSASSSGETTDTPSTPAVHSAATRPSVTPSTTRANAKQTPLTALRRQRAAKAASSASTTPAKAKMLDGDFALPPVNAGASSSSSSKSNHILGPDGQLYTQGEAAKLGLIIRTACEACRNRKLKCSGTLPENGGCGRCSNDGIQCIYSARAPIGRPKKRKVEEAPDPATASPSKSSVASAKGKAKHKHSASNSLGDISARIKTEEATPFDSPASSQAALSFASSPALQHIHNSAYFSGQSNLPVSPAQSDRLLQRTASHDGSPAGFVAPPPPPPPFGLYDSPMQAPAVPDSNSSSSRIVSTPTVWSQNPTAFALTPSDTTTPHSIISPALASTSFADDQHSQQQSAPHASTSASAAKLPSLDDLSVAAFLQSLDTLEISPAELFQQQQQLQQQVQPFSAATSSSGTPNAANAYGLGTPFNQTSSGVSAPVDQLSASSLEHWATSSAVLQPGLSFAVPADFSWWDLGINGADVGAGSAAASVSATPSTEISSMAFPSNGGVPSRLPTANVSQGQSSSSDSSSVVDGSSIVEPSSSQRAERSQRPTFSADQLWPRGADAGMGQGQIQHAVAATETGLGWSTLPGPSQMAEALSSPVDSQAGNAVERSSCCSSKSNKTASLSPAEVKDGRNSGAGVGKASCCSSKSTVDTTTKEHQKPASCCAGKGAKETNQPPQKEEPKSCCSNHAPTPSSTTTTTTTTADDPTQPTPLSTSPTLHTTLHTTLPSHPPSKVHCVPNPSGKGCTCLCDMSVALLSVKQVLRQTDPHKPSPPPHTTTTSSANYATDTIQLTLTASQAIAAQCACSADCPTCQSDPSTEISASLLVSTALQIYARAVRILREGFAASTSGTTTTTTSSGKDDGGVGFFGGLDVTIGSYKPSAGNAKRIALYAIKLELKDLRRALGKVSRMAQDLGLSTTTTTTLGLKVSEGEEEDVAEGEEKEKKGGEKGGEKKGEKGKKGMNPIDQLVILKLYRQLTELLKTIEGLEDAA
ncbi:uncharacterized protein SPSC_00039 [Sporisorium scitamineum]|uniref:Zn(2)-C6 fungal-type domain-containing protein n=1 Tax=Sporisorium scitamineum TaxID=49012 RepID=A0A127Z6T7_9BASI|nr:uncharacterized protein SPSC_00039 [Sporisorium scitamineum]